MPRRSSRPIEALPQTVYGSALRDEGIEAEVRPDLYRLRGYHDSHSVGPAGPVGIDGWPHRLEQLAAIQRSHSSGEEVRIDACFREHAVRLPCRAHPIQHDAHARDAVRPGLPRRADEPEHCSRQGVPIAHRLERRGLLRPHPPTKLLAFVQVRDGIEAERLIGLGAGRRRHLDDVKAPGERTDR